MSNHSSRVGTLSDGELRTEANHGRLIVENFSDESVRQACYELRASSVFYRPPSSESHAASSDGAIVIRPGELVVIITLEKLNLPADVIGRVLSKGQLCSIGLVPINTYADPGFVGKLGIILQNNGFEYIRISVGDAIAKIEFSRLAVAVDKPYTGQHGYETKIWPIPVDKLLRGKDLIKYKQANGLDDVLDELRLTEGDQVYLLARRVFRYERRLLYFAIAFMLVAVLGLTWPDKSVVRSANIVGFVIGVASSLCAMFITYFATNLRRR